jgi:hypothetical protein
LLKLITPGGQRGAKPRIARAKMDIKIKSIPDSKL